MKLKNFSVIGILFTLFFSLGALASQGVFPVSTHFDSAKNCSVATDFDPQFCANFKNAVQGCAPIPGLSMQKIYKMMVAVYGSLQNACDKNAAKYGGDPKICVGQWNCYWNGGIDPNDTPPDNQCDGDGKPCDSL